MNKYIALLRGINVSGQKKILMADLRELLLTSGFKNVQTYIQSGNIIFESESKNKQDLEKQIYTYIYKEYNFEVPVIIKQVNDWKNILENNPFLSDKNINTKTLYVTFLKRTPSNDDLKKLLKYDFSPDAYHINKNIIYSCYPNGAGRSKMTNNIFEKNLETVATSRNWNTVNKLFSLSK